MAPLRCQLKSLHHGLLQALLRRMESPPGQGLGKVLPSRAGFIGTEPAENLRFAPISAGPAPPDQIPKLRVAGSNPVSRSTFRRDDEGFRGDPGALRLSGRRENLARARCGGSHGRDALAILA